eukprot:CAMPEP_0119546114 /NCGR_PEP_ID=MMETSP1352-20130426/665_1 /TAXON_ID=265584 /ORGANISM="Stauroneis constricta, Strain CCMP1120" /LENGTH=435 /DNA_ID=CAMNT_0007590779 /DNA_START=106 /DNA_END=1413 /DNA_ORIENTATION=+
MESPTYQSIPSSSSSSADPLANPATTNKANGNAAHRYDDDGDERVCRICLEEDQPETMIAAVHVQGELEVGAPRMLGSLADQPARSGLFQMHGMPLPVPPATAAVPVPEPSKEDQVLLAGVTGHVRNHHLAATGHRTAGGRRVGVGSATTTPRNVLRDIAMPDGDWHSKGIYYLSGFLLLFVMMGIAGSITLCVNKCSIKESIPTFLSDSNDGLESSHPPSTSRAPSASERVMYRQHRQRQASYGNNDCCLVYNHPVYYVDSGDGSCCCCCCCCDGGSGGRNGCGDGLNACCNGARCCDGCDVSGGDSSGGNGGDDCIHVLVIIVVVTAIIMAIIGFVVGIIIAVIMCQRIIQTHIHLVQKRQLVKEFTVMDLSGYNMDESPPPPPPSPSAPLLPSDQEDEEMQERKQTYHPPPSAPTLDDEDEIYLQKLGLLAS